MLFHRVISLSGFSVSPWAVRTKNTQLNSQYLSEKLCPKSLFQNDSIVWTNKIQCLQSKNVLEYLNVMLEILERTEISLNKGNLVKFRCNFCIKIQYCGFCGLRCTITTKYSVEPTLHQLSIL